ncbi:hypothetical protein MMC30_003396 [Trapelia coarctata]|nr:hypothetical protein [Trapelia coarctata]
MSDVRDYLLTVDRDKQGALQIAQGTASKLEKKEVTLINIVQSLGEYINDEDDTIRSKAVGFLSQVIGALQPTFLSRQQIQVLCQFLCDRIEDGGAVGGLTKLQELRRFNKEMTIMTLRAMLEHFQDLQIRPQSQRHQILALLNGLMSNHRPATLSLGDESLVGILDLVSGEKDPRNLMMVFSILKVIMVEWDIVKHAETLFDAVFCYFPITFRPPPDDPYGITAQDLKTRLRECIASSRYFAPYAFPQLIDKLDSTSPTVKKDVLQTISACATSYGVTTISTYSVTLWDSLKYEILNIQEEDLAEEALSALRTIAEKLSHGLNSTDPKTPLASYLRPITKECNEQLQAPQHKQAKPAGQILKSLGTASPVAFFLIVKAVVPPLLTLYQDADSIAKQRALLEVLLQLLEAALSSYGTVSLATEPAIENPLGPFKDRLFEMFSQALMSTAKEEVSFRVVALKCLERLCSLRKFLQDNEIGMAVQYFNDIVLSDDADGRDDLKNAAIEALVEISKIKPALIMDITFPAFMARLPDTCAEGDRAYLVTLEGLARVSVEKATSDTLVRRLFNRLDAVLQNPGTPHYPQAILSTLQYVLSRRDLVSDPNLNSYFEKMVALIKRTATASTDPGMSTALSKAPTMVVLGRLFCLIVHALDSHRQRSVCGQAYTLFCEKDQCNPVLPPRLESTEAQRHTIILSTYLLAGVSRDAWQIPLPYGQDHFMVYLNDLIATSLHIDSPISRRSALQQIALLVNKFTSNENLHYVTETLLAPHKGLLGSTTYSAQAIRVGFWIAKGLILRLANTEEVLNRLLSLLENSEHGASAARGFELLLAPDEILSKENGATIRLLAKQKVFSVCIPVISEGFRSADPAVKSNYLVALSGILKHTATAVLLPEIGTLLPLLLQSLDIQDQEVKAASIVVLAIVTKESPTAVEEHVSSVVSRLLKSAADPKSNSTKVRYNALVCLRSFPGKVKESALLPYRRAVTRGMMTVLDDPKRDVRKEAVDCRSAWSNIDEPEEDD